MLVLKLVGGEDGFNPTTELVPVELSFSADISAPFVLTIGVVELNNSVVNPKELAGMLVLVFVDNWTEAETESLTSGVGSPILLPVNSPGTGLVLVTSGSCFNVPRTTVVSAFCLLLASNVVVVILGLVWVLCTGVVVSTA